MAQTSVYYKFQSLCSTSSKRYGLQHGIVAVKNAIWCIRDAVEALFQHQKVKCICACSIQFNMLTKRTNIWIYISWWILQMYKATWARTPTCVQCPQIHFEFTFWSYGVLHLNKLPVIFHLNSYFFVWDYLFIFGHCILVLWKPISATEKKIKKSLLRIFTSQFWRVFFFSQLWLFFLNIVRYKLTIASNKVRIVRYKLIILRDEVRIAI